MACYSIRGKIFEVASSSLNSYPKHFRYEHWCYSQISDMPFAHPTVCLSYHLHVLLCLDCCILSASTRSEYRDSVIWVYPHLLATNDSVWCAQAQNIHTYSTLQHSIDGQPLIRVYTSW